MHPILRYIITQSRWITRLMARNLELEDEVKKLKSQLQRQQRLNNENEILKDAIVRNVSHELKTPLLHLKSAIWMLDDTETTDKQGELVHYAKQATTRLEILVKNISLLSASSQVSPGPVIVRDALEYAKRNLRRIWEYQKDIARVEFDSKGDIPPVFADKQGLSIVLQLLLDNALKFSEKEVVVRVSLQADQVRIMVDDCGIGIPKDKIDKIFDSFYQIDFSSTRQYGGMGIGLAIVRLILDRHQVQIFVESEVGKGSKFWFDLPIVSIPENE
ncbi:MAG: HAMP domain-containing sensor histidine kinase [Phototrophicales bacterium]|nr:HAMP domain-containing sensor histidine kinase [Phototrophicales bacterium]